VGLVQQTGAPGMVAPYDSDSPVHIAYSVSRLRTCHIVIHRYSRRKHLGWSDARVCDENTATNKKERQHRQPFQSS